MKFERQSDGTYEEQYRGGYRGRVRRAGKRWLGELLLNGEQVWKTELLRLKSEAERALYAEACATTHTVRNLMTNKPVTESITLPYTCSVSSETYWSS